MLATASSDAVLPAIMLKLEVMSINKSVVGLVAPTGYSFNLDAFWIDLTLAVVFIAQPTNTRLSIGDLLLVLGISLLTSKGAHGVPGWAIVILAAALNAVPTIPDIGLVLVLSADWFIGMARAAGNLIGNCVATELIAARAGTSTMSGPHMCSTDSGACRRNRWSRYPRTSGRSPRDPIQCRSCEQGPQVLNRISRVRPDLAADGAKLDARMETLIKVQRSDAIMLPGDGPAAGISREDQRGLSPGIALEPDPSRVDIEVAVGLDRRRRAGLDQQVLPRREIGKRWRFQLVHSFAIEDPGIVDRCRGEAPRYPLVTILPLAQIACDLVSLLTAELLAPIGGDAPFLVHRVKVEGDRPDGHGGEGAGLVEPGLGGEIDLVVDAIASDERRSRRARDMKTRLSQTDRYAFAQANGLGCPGGGCRLDRRRGRSGQLGWRGTGHARLVNGWPARPVVQLGRRENQHQHGATRDRKRLAGPKIHHFFLRPHGLATTRFASSEPPFKAKRRERP